MKRKEKRRKERDEAVRSQTQQRCLWLNRKNRMSRLLWSWMRRKNRLDKFFFLFFFCNGALCREMYQNWNSGDLHQTERNTKIAAQNMTRRYKYHSKCKRGKDGETWRRLKRIEIVVFWKLVSPSFAKFIYVVCNVGDTFVWHEVLILSFTRYLSKFQSE